MLISADTTQIWRMHVTNNRLIYMKYNEPTWLSEKKMYFPIYSLLWGCLFFFFFLLLTWMKMYGARVCVFSLLLMGPVSPPPPPLPHHEPRQAEWQGSGLAKWWNDDPIMRSDSKMRGIRQRLHPSLTATPSPLLHTARCPDDDWFARDGSQEAPIDFAVFYQKYVFTVVSIGRMHTYPASPFSERGRVSRR